MYVHPNLFSVYAADFCSIDDGAKYLCLREEFVHTCSIYLTLPASFAAAEIAPPYTQYSSRSLLAYGQYT